MTRKKKEKKKHKQVGGFQQNGHQSPQRIVENYFNTVNTIYPLLDLEWRALIQYASAKKVFGYTSVRRPVKICPIRDNNIFRSSVMKRTETRQHLS